MAQDSDEVVVGANGSFNTAPYGTALPTTVTAALNAAFNEHGFVSEDGVTFRDEKEVEDILAWQSFYPVRKVVSAKTSGVEAVLRQFNPENAKLAFGGGQVTVTGGAATYEPPPPDEIQLISAVIEWIDGDSKFRLVVPRATGTGEVESVVNRTAAADLPIALEATPEGIPVPGTPTTFPFYIVSDHPAWLAAS